MSLVGGEGDGAIPRGTRACTLQGWASQGSLGACLLPANCQDLPVLCQECCPLLWSDRLAHLLPFLAPRLAVPLGDGVQVPSGHRQGGQHQWSALRALLHLLPG